MSDKPRVSRCRHYPNCPEVECVIQIGHTEFDEDTNSSFSRFGSKIEEGPCDMQCRLGREAREMRNKGPINHTVLMILPNGQVVDIGL
jgi:hypothetical protein